MGRLRQGINMRRLISRYRTDAFLPNARHVPGPPDCDTGEDSPSDPPVVARARHRGLARRARRRPPGTQVRRAGRGRREPDPGGHGRGKGVRARPGRIPPGIHRGDLQAAYDAYDELGGNPQITSQAAGTVNDMIEGAGNDLGRALAARTDPDSGYDGMLTAAWGAISGDQAGAPSLLASRALWAAIGAGALALYQLAGVGTVTWTAGGPDPCQQCANNAGGSPYQAWAVPAHPAHPNCRCGLDTTDLIDRALLVAFMPGR